MDKTHTILSANDFDLYSPTGELLCSLNFLLNSGEALILRGANGTGKSTFLRLIFNLLNNTPKKKIPELSLSKVKSFSYLPQSLNREFFIPMTLLDVASLHDTVADSQHTGLLDKHLQTKPWNVASGGEKQRALLAQTLAPKRSLYLLDEPFNHLDKGAIGLVTDLIKEKLEKSEATFIIATHTLPDQLLELGKKLKSIGLKRSC